MNSAWGEQAVCVRVRFGDRAVRWSGKSRGQAYRWRTALCVLCAAFCFGAAFAQDATGPLVLTIGWEAAPLDTIATVPITLTTNGTRPSTVVFSMRFDPAHLAFDPESPGRVSTGPAALAVDKYAEANSPEEGVVTVAIFGMTEDQDPMQDGEVARVQFSVVTGELGDRIALQGENGSAATPEGASILVEMVDGGIEVSCVGRPRNVIASQGDPSAVELAWDPVTNATEYRVYHGETDDPASAQVLADWFSATETWYTDISAEAATGDVRGCRQDVRRYYYWVQARDATGCEGVLSLPAEGYRGLDTKGASQGASAMGGDGLLWLGMAGVLGLLSHRRRAPSV